MNTEETVKVLSTLTTRTEAGRHFTSLLSSTTISTLEGEGLITVNRPVHSTGIPYSEEHWSVEVTPEGVCLVEAYPEYVTNN